MSEKRKIDVGEYLDILIAVAIMAVCLWITYKLFWFSIASIVILIGFYFESDVTNFINGMKDKWSGK